MKSSLTKRFAEFACGLIFIAAFSAAASAQGGSDPVAKPAEVTKTSAANLPKITQIDEVALKKLLTPNGKPLLVNFWATWCVPCREEFPDLVRIDADYKGKIDFITVSLDDLAEIDRDVPKFLAQMKAEMPAYLLKSLNEDAAIAAVSPDWKGGLPYSILIGTDGKTVYTKQGKVSLPSLKLYLDRALKGDEDKIHVVADFVKIRNGKRDEAIFYYENNWKIYRDAAIKRGVIHSYELVEANPEPNAAFDLILITRYKGTDQFNNIEKNFEPIMKELRPDGPVLKNESKPESFREIAFGSQGKTTVSSFR